MKKQNHHQVVESIKMDDNSIQVLAYQIHNEKGGTQLDNWLEAEQSLKNDQRK